jgi:hypothetical protein
MTNFCEGKDDIAVAIDGATAIGTSVLVARRERFPSSELVVYGDRIIISNKWTHRAFVFPRASILAIQRGGIIWDSFRIMHARQDCPPFVAFCPAGGSDFLAEGLHRFGYPLTEASVRLPVLTSPKLSWPFLFGPPLAALIAFALAVLFKTRSLHSMQFPTILSTGRLVPTGELAAFFARRFAIVGMVLGILSLVLVALRLWQRHGRGRVGGQEGD